MDIKTRRNLSNQNGKLEKIKKTIHTTRTFSINYKCLYKSRNKFEVHAVNSEIHRHIGRRVYCL